MKKTIGGERLRGGKGVSVNMHAYVRSNHDLSHTVRTSMNAGTLVPVLKMIGLPGDTFDINISEMFRTVPTNNALFGRFKYQVDFFVEPLRLTVGAMHNNMLDVGKNAHNIILPKIRLGAAPKTKFTGSGSFEVDTQQIAADALNKYLGISGVGFNDSNQIIKREFLGAYHIAYGDICKNYYINTQEENAYVIGGVEENKKTASTLEADGIPQSSYFILQTSGRITTQEPTVTFILTENWNNINSFAIKVKDGETATPFTVSYTKNGENFTALFETKNGQVQSGIQVDPQNSNKGKILFASVSGTPQTIYAGDTIAIYYKTTGAGYGLQEFPIKNFDKCRNTILKACEIGEYVTIIGSNEAVGDDIKPINFLPYSVNAEILEDNTMLCKSSQVGLILKTYLNDLFNNFVQTDWIEEVNKRSAISVQNGTFTIDSLLINKRVFNYLNRIMVSKGTLADWQEVTYGVDAQSFVESPLFVGGVSGNIVFDEVVSTSATADEALGTLAGRGNIDGGSRKGGQVNIKIKEPSVILAIASITPYIDYSQGNSWEMSQIETLEDLHKPEFDGIGFQDANTEQLAWWDAQLNTENNQTTVKNFSFGKQPAWVQYMTEVNKVYGDFARELKQEGMVITRNYKPKDSFTEGVSNIKDLTTYIDPTNYSYLFAGTSLEDQPFWAQFHFNILARRKMSAAIMPNL